MARWQFWSVSEVRTALASLLQIAWVEHIAAVSARHEELRRGNDHLDHVQVMGAAEVDRHWRDVQFSLQVCEYVGLGNLTSVEFAGALQPAQEGPEGVLERRGPQRV